MCKKNKRKYIKLFILVGGDSESLSVSVFVYFSCVFIFQMLFNFRKHVSNSKVEEVLNRFSVRTKEVVSAKKN